MDPTRVAVIGCGAIANGGHLPAYRAAAAAGLCRLVGVCDIDRERAQQSADQYGVKPFERAADLLAQTRPEVVSITTFPASHRDLALLAFDAGCHVLCEKPVALHYGEAAAMVRAAARAQRLLSVCFQYRYWDESVYLKEHIAALGPLHAVRTWGGNAHCFPTSPGYHRQASAGGGALAHWTIHNLDLILWLLGYPEPLRASAFCHQRLARYPAALGPALSHLQPADIEASIEDFAMGLVRLAGDTVVTVEANFLQPPSDRREGWEFLGARGAAAIAPLRLWLDEGDVWIERTPPPGALAPCGYGMERLIAAFLKAVRQGDRAPVASAEILCLQRLVDALYASSRCGREVAVEKMHTEGEDTDA